VNDESSKDVAALLTRLRAWPAAEIEALTLDRTQSLIRYAADEIERLSTAAEYWKDKCHKAWEELDEFRSERVLKFLREQRGTDETSGGT
jgi:hypothetical protein